MPIPPWISTTLNRGYFESEDLVGKIFEAKALVGKERQGYFIGVVLSSTVVNKEIRLEVQVCGASEKDFFDVVQKRWKNPCQFYLSRHPTGDSKDYKEKGTVVRPICALRIMTLDEMPELDLITKRSVTLQHAKKAFQTFRS